jgi:hypothetical protein
MTWRYFGHIQVKEPPVLKEGVTPTRLTLTAGPGASVGSVGGSAPPAKSVGRPLSQ